MDPVLIKAFTELGALAGLVVFFTWRDWRRESRRDKLEEKKDDRFIALLEHFTKQTASMIELAERSEKTIIKSEAAMKAMAAATDRLNEVLHIKPCLFDTRLPTMRDFEQPRTDALEKKAG